MTFVLCGIGVGLLAIIYFLSICWAERTYLKEKDAAIIKQILERDESEVVPDDY